MIRKIKSDDQGATAVEYGLILALVFLAMIGAAQSFGSQTIAMWNGVAATIDEAKSE